MYDKLIKRLRECAAEVNGEKTLWHQAADAIEELQTVVDGLTAQTNMVFEKTEGRTVIKFEPKWIPVAERLPDYDEVVQITDGIEVGHGYLEGIDTTVGIALLWHSPFCDIDEEHITHWMPLPKAPESEGK